MSRRSRLATVVRVADLRETLARGQVAAAGAATARAVHDEQARREALGEARVDGTALQATAALLAWRAEAVVLAGAAVGRARAARADAVVAHQDAARRARLFATLADRLREEDEVRRLQADQRAADDSTGARHVRGGAA